MKKTLFLLVILSIIFSCSGEKTEDNTVLEIPVEIQDNQSADFMKTVIIDKVVALDDSIPVGTVRKACLFNGNIYVLNKKAEELICFDENGQLKYCIRAKGRGPEEYVAIQNFFIDEKAGNVTILSPDNKMLQYDGMSGRLKKVISTGTATLMPLDGVRMKDGSLALYTMGPAFNLEVFWQDADTSCKYIPFVEIRDMVFSDRAFSDRDHCCRFVHGTSDFIYALENDTVIQKYYINFGEDGITPELYMTAPEEVETVYNKRKVACKLDNLLETSRLLTFSYLVFSPGSPNVVKQYVVYDKRNKQGYNIAGKNPLFPVMDGENGVFVSIVDPVAVLDWDDTSQGVKEVKEAISRKQLHEESNPVLVTWKIK